MREAGDYMHARQRGQGQQQQLVPLCGRRVLLPVERCSLDGTAHHLLNKITAAAAMQRRTVSVESLRVYP